MHAISARLLVVSTGLALAACGGDSTFGTGSGGSGSGGAGGGGRSAVQGSGSTADHLAAAAFDGIPDDAVERAKSSLRILYGHTSHGHQLMVGLEMLETEDALYDRSEGPSIDEVGGDLGSVDWAGETRAALGGDGNGYNVVVWSWCGQVAGASTETIDGYLAAMNELEAEYADAGVQFVYMTGHTDGTGDDDSLRVNNARIREYCAANGKWLFDFEDIESWTPANEYQEYTSDSCEWCSTWCDENECPASVVSEDFGCDHSHPFNCYLKGKAFWWLLARMAGWSGQ
jgi:hypothetical protein